MSNATCRITDPPNASNSLEAAAAASQRQPTSQSSLNERTVGGTPDTPNLATLKEVRYWLEWQSRMISGVISGGVFLKRDPLRSGEYDEVILPEQASDSDLLRIVAKETLVTKKSTVSGSVPQGETPYDLVAQPLKRNQDVVGAVVFTLTNRTKAQRDSVQQLLRWCVVWLENLLESAPSANGNTAGSQLRAVQLLSDAAPLEVTAYRLCSHLADELECSVVVLGLEQNWDLQALAVSHQLGFDRKTQSIQDIELVMQECADQDTTIALSNEPNEASIIVTTHASYLKKSSDTGICSVPIRSDSSLIGVLTLLKSGTTPFTIEQLQTIESIAASVGPIIHLQTLANQSLLSKVRRACMDFQQKLFGTNNYKLKTVVGLLIIVPLLLALVPAQQRITATASLEGSMQRSIVAPVDGYIKTVLAKAGETVEQGQSLVVLDTNDLMFEREKNRSEHAKLNNEYQLAWANRDKGQIAILSARLAQSEAQLALINSEMDQSQILAPFDGQLISGDLSHLSGTPVQQGQLLFELVPLTGFKLTLDINEYDVGKLADGQSGVLRLAGMPDEPIEFVVQKAQPVASIKQHQSVFRVEAVLQDPPQNLRPGMQGIGKIAVGSSSVGSVLTQSLRERLKMFLWYFGF